MIKRPIQFCVMLIAILAAMGSAFVVSKRVSSDAPKRVLSANPQQYPPPREEDETMKALKARIYGDPRSIPRDAAEKALLASRKEAQDPVITVVDQWTNIGPAPIMGGQICNPVGVPRVSGRILDIAVDPNQAATHWFIAAEGGGIWETTNGGTSWIPKLDGDVIAVPTTAIGLAPSNPQILFAGTVSFFNTNNYLMRSTDGGATWPWYQPFPSYFGPIKVDPTNPNIVVALNAGAGVYRSVNSLAGAPLYSVKLAGPGRALATRYSDFSKQYATISPGGSDHQVHRSTDGGNTWSRVFGPWDNQPGYYVKLATGSASAPSTVYLILQKPDLTLQIWKSLDGWSVGAPIFTPLVVSGLPAFDLGIPMVDPTNSNILYLGGMGEVGFGRINANNTWTAFGAIGCPAPPVNSTHVDQRAMAPAVTTLGTPMLLLGNDGGFWTSVDSGITWNNQNSNLSTVQFTFGSLHPTNGSMALGGSTDNGTEFWTGTTGWTFENGGDGQNSAFSKDYPDYRWAIINNVQFLKYLLDGMGGIVATCNVPPPGQHIVKLKRSPNNEDLLAGALSDPQNNTATLWKATDFFGPLCVQPNWTANGTITGPSEVGAIAFAPSDNTSQTYAYAAGPELRYTTNGGANWKDLDPNGVVPNRPITAIAFHPNNPAVVYVALGQFSGSNLGHILMTTNALANPPPWFDVSPAVDLPITALAIDPVTPSTMYAGFELGVRKTTNSGSSWTDMGPSKGMPRILVLDLLFGPDNRLVAYTYGRGAFKLNVGSLQVTITPPAAVAAGAKWKVDADGQYQNSGATVVGLSPGPHTVYFKPIGGYSPPANQSISVIINQTVQTTGNYVPNK